MSHHAAVTQQGGHRPHPVSGYGNPAAEEDGVIYPRAGASEWRGGVGRGADPERAAVRIPTGRPLRRQTGLEPLSEPSMLL